MSLNMRVIPCLTVVLMACHDPLPLPQTSTATPDGGGDTVTINSTGGVITCDTPGETRSCCGTGTMTCLGGEIATFGPCLSASGMPLQCCIPSEFGSCGAGGGTGSGGTGPGGGSGGSANLAPACALPYPFSSADPRTSVAFSESSLLTGVSPAVAHADDVIKAFYIDEHALTLGASGAGHTVSPFAANLNAVAGTASAPALSVGDPAAEDPAHRPIYPALFLTDITNDMGSMAGDWQHGGAAIPPTAVYGTWKEANGADPPRNLFDVGNGDTVPQIPAGGHDSAKQYFSTEVQWQVSALGLLPGHTYRVQVMLHDGDQNDSGGDAGEGCVVVQGQ